MQSFNTDLESQEPVHTWRKDTQALGQNALTRALHAGTTQQQVHASLSAPEENTETIFFNEL